MFYYINKYAKSQISLCKCLVDKENTSKFKWTRIKVRCYLYSLLHFRKAKQEVMDVENIIKKIKEE